MRGLPYLLGFIWGVSGPQAEEQKAEPPFGLEKRIPWTTSRLVGSPDPPLPFTVERDLSPGSNQFHILTRDARGQTSTLTEATWYAEPSGEAQVRTEEASG